MPLSEEQQLAMDEGLRREGDVVDEVFDALEEQVDKCLDANQTTTTSIPRGR